MKKKIVVRSMKEASKLIKSKKKSEREAGLKYIRDEGTKKIKGTKSKFHALKEWIF